MRTRFPFNKHDYDNGIELQLNIDFIPVNDKEMELLQVTVSQGFRTVDYVFVAETRTLLDVIKEFMHE